MKVFIIGTPKSGRSTLAKSICQELNFKYIDASNWIKSTFRPQNEKELIQQYQDKYYQHLSDLMKSNPNICYKYVIDSIEAFGENNSFVIDGIFSPQDLAKLFDFNQDVIVFMNRTDNDYEYKESDNIAVSVMRDLCFWLSSANLLAKSRWIEFNFKMSGGDINFIKELGSKNRVMIVRSFNKIIITLKEILLDICPNSAI